MYHVELRQFPHVARVFNLNREELDARFVGPWVKGDMIEYEDRRWPPERAQLKVYEGPELAADQIGLGRGWGKVTKASTEVTEAVIAAAERGAQARPELDALKEAIAEVAVTPIGGDDVVALAVAAHPTWRASQQLELAEQAVWEMLHQGRLTLSTGGQPVAREGWQAIVLSWATWAGGDGEAIVLQTASA